MVRDSIRKFSRWKRDTRKNGISTCSQITAGPCLKKAIAHTKRSHVEKHFRFP